MSILGRSALWSGRFVCVPLHCRMQNIHIRRLSRLTRCESYIIRSSRSRFESFGSGELQHSLLNHEKQITFFHRSYSSAESSFQDMMSFRQKQAKHSVLVELSSRVDIPSAWNLCKAYGDVKNMIAFVTKKTKLQVLVEFIHEESMQKLLSDSSIKYATEGFPCHSRCLRFENCGKQISSSMAPGEVTELSLGIKNCANKQPSSVSEMMMDLYEKEKMSELSIRLRFLSSVLLQDILKGMFPYCIAFPFGSSANGFGKDTSDLDLMLRLFPEKYSKNPEVYLKTRYVKGNCHALQRYAVYVIGEILQTFVPGVYNVQKIMNARMPIVKYEHQHLNLECDVSVNNIWYEPAGIDEDPDDYRVCAIEYVNEGNSSNLKSTFNGQKNTESLDILLQEFFRFLAIFPFKEQRISVIGGNSNPKEGGYPIWIDYPMDESKNVSKNVSFEELKNLREAAFIALKNLENLSTDLKTANLMSVLGVSDYAQGIPDRIDVRAFLDVKPEEAITHSR